MKKQYLYEILNDALNCQMNGLLTPTPPDNIYQDIIHMLKSMQPNQCTPCEAATPLNNKPTCSRCGCPAADGPCEAATPLNNKPTEKQTPARNPFYWRPEGFEFVTVADSDGSYRTYFPVPGCRPEDVRIEVENDLRVIITAKMQNNSAEPVVVSATIPYGQRLSEAVVEHGLLTLRCTKQAMKTFKQFPVTAPKTL